MENECFHLYHLASEAQKNKIEKRSRQPLHQGFHFVKGEVQNFAPIFHRETGLFLMES